MGDDAGVSLVLSSAGELRPPPRARSPQYRLARNAFALSLPFFVPSVVGGERFACVLGLWQKPEHTETRDTRRTDKDTGNGNRYGYEYEYEYADGFMIYAHGSMIWTRIHVQIKVELRFPCWLRRCYFTMPETRVN